MTTPSQELPTPRTLITLLLNTLCTSPNPPVAHLDPPLHSTIKDHVTPNSNLLGNLPPSSRALLTTLHVIFPPPLLLQALDLLERGAVSRFVYQDSSSSLPGEDTGIPVMAVEADEETDVGFREGVTSEIDNGGKDGEGKRRVVYQVRSLQATKWKGRGFRGGGGGGDNGDKLYIVCLEAWNCSCAAFAFSAFPGGSGGGFHGLEEDQGEDNEDDEEDEGGRRNDMGEAGEEREKWRYGGMGKGEEVPICKHVLACLLGERWQGVLGAYVKERMVGREEMGGLVV